VGCKGCRGEALAPKYSDLTHKIDPLRQCRLEKLVTIALSSGAIAFSLVTSAIAMPFPEAIAVQEFIFEGNQAFSDQELTEVLASFIGRPIYWGELLQAEAAITQHYTYAGYVKGQ